jgi:Concanavalin A-like lectin/glucanases superfamily
VLDGEHRASQRYSPADFQFSLVRFGRNDQTGGQFKGDLDELALWNRALSPADISLIIAR